MENLALNVNCSPIIRVDECPIYEAMTMYITGICHLHKCVANCGRMLTQFDDISTVHHSIELFH
jgi:hypothetical protein